LQRKFARIDGITGPEDIWRAACSLEEYQVELHALQEKASARLMSTEIVRRLTQGSLSREQYKAYMSDVCSYARHSSQVIALAGARMVLSHPQLAKYLFVHAVEEIEHDKWAESDLRDLGMSATELEEIVPSSACARMIGLEYFFAAHANPVGLFGWMFILESFGGRVGGKLAKAIDETLKLNGKGVYFLSGHGEADKQHSADLHAVIEKNVKSRSDQAAFKFMAAESEELYCGILDTALKASP
jgi:heme oxygenase